MTEKKVLKILIVTRNNVSRQDICDCLQGRVVQVEFSSTNDFTCIPQSELNRSDSLCFVMQIANGFVVNMHLQPPNK